MFTDVRESDAAVLQCNATNEHGYRFANAYLNVLGKQRGSGHLSDSSLYMYIE